MRRKASNSWLVEIVSPVRNLGEVDVFDRGDYVFCLSPLSFTTLFHRTVKSREFWLCQRSSLSPFLLKECICIGERGIADCRGGSLISVASFLSPLANRCSGNSLSIARRTGRDRDAAVNLLGVGFDGRQRWRASGDPWTRGSRRDLVGGKVWIPCRG